MNRYYANLLGTWTDITDDGTVEDGQPMAKFFEENLVFQDESTVAECFRYGYINVQYNEKKLSDSSVVCPNCHIRRFRKLHNSSLSNLSIALGSSSFTLDRSKANAFSTAVRTLHQLLYLSSPAACAMTLIFSSSVFTSFLGPLRAGFSYTLVSTISVSSLTDILTTRRYSAPE